MLDALNWLYKNLPSLLLAFLLALVVWISATTQSDPNKEIIFRSVPLQVIGKEDNVFILDELSYQVNIVLYSPDSRIAAIEKQPELLTATLDLTGLKSGTYDIPIQVSFDVKPAKLLRVEPSSIKLHIDVNTAHTFPIELNIIGKPAIGYEAGQPTLDTQEVKVSGAETLLNQVKEVRIHMDITNKDRTIENELPLQIIDKEGNTIDKLNVEPRTVHFQQPITLLNGYRNKVVRVLTVGNVADGYRLDNILVFPLRVLLFSPNPQVLEDMPGYVETEPMDLKNADQNFETRIGLRLPEGVSAVGDQTALVRVSIAAIESSLALKLPIEAIGLSPELTMGASLETVDVILAGPLPVLSHLKEKDVRVLIDLSGLDTGVHQVSPKADILPENVRLLSISPSTVEVNIKSRPENTPTETPTQTDTPTPEKTGKAVRPVTPTRTPKPSVTPQVIPSETLEIRPSQTQGD